MFGVVPTPRMKHRLLVGQSLVYTAAFASLYWQAEGLYGENGITPIATKLEKCHISSPWTCASPLLLFLRHYLSIRPSTALHIVCLLGMLLSALTIAIKKTRNALVYLALVLLYLSAFKVGGTFLWFQWDTLIIESGFLMAILAAFWDSPADKLAIYFIRFLACRLMFASGVVKLQSLCPTWWNLSALDHHFESQCLPTPLAWFAHHQPAWLRRFSVAATFFVECYLPPMFLLPLGPLRWLAGVPQILFMIAIAATGNYNFFNFHYALLAYACLDGTYFASTSLSRMRAVAEWLFAFFIYGAHNAFTRPSFVRIAAEWLLSFAIFGVALYHWSLAFGIRVDTANLVIHSKIAFNRDEFAEFVRIGTSLVIHLGILFAFATFIIVAAFCWRKRVFKHLFFVGFTGSALFMISMVPFTTIDETASGRIPYELRRAHQLLKPFELTHSYGLFRRMTGTDGRPEVIIEGATDPNGPWKELRFHAKPGPIGEQPTFVAPHQPRLDWQMWFAALGTYQHNPWFLSFVNTLLRNNTEVVHLLKDYPFTDKKKPLQFVRAQLYHYHFSKPGAKNWWRRELLHEYMPMFTKDSPAMVDFLADNGLLSTKEYKMTVIDETLSAVHKQALKLDQSDFVWSALGANLLVMFTLDFFFF